MTRALGEYDVRGIKTTIPFFQWLLATDDFRRGRFDTTALDRELASRAGRPFVEVSEALEEVAVISAALHAWFRASARHGASAGAGAGAASRRWQWDRRRGRQWRRRGRHARLRSQRLAADGPPGGAARVTFEIEVNGRTRAVSVERLKHDGSAGVAFRVIIDGTPHLVDAVRVDGGALSFIQLDGEARPGGRIASPSPRARPAS